MPKFTFEQKRARIRELEEIIQQAESELKELIDPTEKAAPLPSNFNVNEKVCETIKEQSNGINKKDIIKQIKEKYGVELPSVKVQAAISSLKYYKKIQIIGRATYKAT